MAPVRRCRCQGHETDALTDIALDVMSRLKPPFCLFVAFQAPHPPCTPRAFLDLYRADRLKSVRTWM